MLKKLCLSTFLIGLLGVSTPATSHAKAQVYVDFPANYLPANPTQHPRVYLNGRIPALQALYKATPQNAAVAAFKHDIGKLLTYTTATQDWRADSGWPAAALALDWLLSGNVASGQKACSVFIPYFTGTSTHNEQSDIYYALVYDWLYNHPCFDSTMKASLRAKLIAWSDDTATADEAGSWTAHDSDRNIAATAGHFISGLAILGEDQANGLKLLKRGWTGWKYGLNASAQLSDFPVADLFRKNLDTGIPLPGWDYGMLSDMQKAQNLFYVLDELGVIDAEYADLKVWWVNALTYFMHSVDPANTHWRWIGDQQTDVFLSQGTGYVWSFLSNCVFLAERYGHSAEAAIGRSFLDKLSHPSYGLSDGDTMLWFVTSWPDSAPRSDYTTSAKRYVLGGLGPSQHMGIGMFRSSWTSPTSATASQQVTWGGFYGIGSYIVDHMHNIAGSFWLWRNGEYLLTEPENYGGNEAAIYPATMWNSLSIPNEAVPNNNEQYDNGGPVVYFNQNSAYLEHGRAKEEESVFYVRLNGDFNYNVPDNMYATCTGVCRQPVSRYTRSFYYDGSQEVVFLIDRVDLARPRPTGLRFRTQNATTLGTAVDNDTVSLPSDKGSYRTLIRVLTPTGAPAWTIAKEPWSSVPDSQIKTSMVGSQVRKTFASATQHRIVTVLQIGKTSDGSSALASAGLITSAGDSIGACAMASCFLTAADHAATSRTTVNYTTPATMAQGSRQLVADMDPGSCYQVTSSTGGTVATGLGVSPDDHTLQFTLPSAGTQDISITPTTGDCSASSGAGSGSATGCSCRLGPQVARDGRAAPAAWVLGLAMLALGGIRWQKRKRGLRGR